MKALLLVISVLVAGVASQSPSPAPTTTTTAAPGPDCTPTAAKPNSVTQTYVHKTCLVMRFAGFLTVGTNKYVDLQDGQVDESASSCGPTGSTNATTSPPKLAIKFPCVSLEFTINQDNASQVYVSDITAKYLNETFDNSSNHMFVSSAGHYYKCNAEQFVTFNNTLASLSLSNFAYEAYRNTTGTDFYLVPEECPLDSSQVSDLVRIGVGVCLVALVALVLIAYFVGRRRWAERSSYESV